MVRSNLKIGSWYSGENTTIRGTLVIDGIEHTLDCQGSASARGTYATVDGKKYWWYGADENSENPKIEQAVDDLYEDVWRQVEALGYDVDDGWVATVIDGRVTNVDIEEVDEEDESDPEVLSPE